LDLWARDELTGRVHTRSCFVLDGACGELATEHVDESQSEVTFGTSGTLSGDKLYITGGVLATITGRIIAERTDA